MGPEISLTFHVFKQDIVDYLALPHPETSTIAREFATDCARLLLIDLDSEIMEVGITQKGR